MSLRKILGAALVVIGLVGLLWGGVSWTRHKTVLDAGPVEIKTAQREGFTLSPIVGAVILVGGIVLLVLPDRKRV